MGRYMGQIMAECDCQHQACEMRGYCMSARIEKLESKLSKAAKALEWVKFGGGPRGESYHELACQVLAELKDEKC